MTSPHAIARIDLYASIHKALRAQMMDALHAAGRVDVHDSADLHALCQRVLSLSTACASHLRHEDDHIHPALEMRAPGASRHAATEHAQQHVAIADLQKAAVCLGEAHSATQRHACAQELYRKLNVFVAENLDHMLAEEVEHTPVLWACYSDDELHALHGRILAAIPPAENLATLRWLVPALPPAERARLLCTLRANAPVPVYTAALHAVQPHLSDKDWAKLESALAPEAKPA